MGNDMSVEIGNLNEVHKEHPERAGWVVGDFIKESRYRKTQSCEVKYIHLPKGFQKPSNSKMRPGERTLTILISGAWHLRFQDGKEVLLSHEGDYALFGPEDHHGQALDDTHVVVVRWQEI